MLLLTLWHADIISDIMTTVYWCYYWHIYIIYMVWPFTILWMVKCPLDPLTFIITLNHWCTLPKALLKVLCIVHLCFLCISKELEVFKWWVMSPFPYSLKPSAWHLPISIFLFKTKCWEPQEFTLCSLLSQDKFHTN